MAQSKIFLLYVFMSIVSNSFGFLGFHNHDWKLKLPYPEFAEDIIEQWITQPLDHFNAKDTRTWPMRYFGYQDFWRPGGPILIYIGGESAASKHKFSMHVFRSLAEETKGAMFVTEHRFYGESIPFNDTSTENLLYLSSRQALADVNNFVTQLKSQEQFKDAKVVVIGGSYAGNLAAWARALYPGLIDAALASSAPVLAKADFYEYFDVVGEVFKKFNPKCSETFVKRNQRYIQQLKTPEGRKQFKKDLNICDSVDMSVPNNVHLFFYQLMSHLSGLVQYGNPKKIERETCPKIDAIATNNDECKDFYDFKELMKHMRESNSSTKPWYYQTCSEFGYFKTNSPDNYLSINITLNFHMDFCTLLFGPELDRKRIDDGIRSTNEMYQGLKPNVTRVFFVNGDIDPWHKLGVLGDLSASAPARVIANASHCADLAYSDKDNKEIPVVVELVKEKIKEWIGM